MGLQDGNNQTEDFESNYVKTINQQSLSKLNIFDKDIEDSSISQSNIIDL